MNVEFDTSANNCAQCPYDSIGDYPNCECSNNGYFEGEFCKNCPHNSNGTYPNCICEESAIFMKDSNQCLNCPSDRYVIEKKYHPN